MIKYTSKGTIKQVKNEKIQQNTLFLETAESPFLLDKDNPNQSTLQHLSDITLGDFFTNNLFEPKDTYQWLLTYWDSEGTHLVTLYDELEKTCQEALNFNHKLTKIIAVPSNQSLDIII